MKDEQCEISMIHVGNAPCSWGTLEFEGLGENKITFAQMLDELAETGYTGTELGDWGFMPTDPAVLRQELVKRNLTMTGAFVPVNFRDPDCHADGEARAVKTARLLALVAGEPSAPVAPFLVLADDNGRDPIRTKHAGRVTLEMGLSDAEWRAFADGVNRVARAVRTRTGLRCVFHHHCAGFVETQDEIIRLLILTDPDLVGLVFDTGHFAFGSGQPDGDGVMRALELFGPRVWYVHLKDCSPDVAQRARAEGWDYHTSVAHGVFCELGQGCVPFERVAAWLNKRSYDGFVTVEQDVLPGMGAPKESARRNREYLRGIGI
jgi:inosose dehydratase